MDETPIEVVAYDPVWPERFDAVADRFRAVLGERLARLEHVGSTAVPGLAAKPVVDVRAMVGADGDLSACVDLLERETAFEYEADVRHWKLLRRPGEDDRVRLYNLHLTTIDGDAWRRTTHTTSKPTPRRRPTSSSESSSARGRRATTSGSEYHRDFCRRTA